MTAPLVSVIMAVHNGAADVGRSIPSVLSQDFQDFEFVIVDDASSDATPELINGYDDPRIVYRRNETNLGQTASLNLAIRRNKSAAMLRDLSRGQLVMSPAQLEPHRGRSNGL